MAQRDNLIATYQSNPTLQSQYTQQQYLDMFGFGLPTVAPTPTPTPTPTPGVPGIINQNINQYQGGGGDGISMVGGIGDFGNLDPSTKKTMQVEVADGKGGVMIKEVDTYLDKGGLRKTLDNKNPVNAGIDVKPLAISLIESLSGKKTDSEFLPEGKILGTFNNPNYKDMSFFGKIKADNLRQKELRQLQKEFELQEKLKEQIRQEAQAAQARQDAATVASAYDRFSRGDDSAYSSGAAGVQSDGSYNDPFDPGGGEKDGGFIDGTNRRKYDDGGRVYLYNRLK
jgi:hypothetical protein